MSSLPALLVVVVADDPALTELLVEAIVERGHVAHAVSDAAHVAGLLRVFACDAVVIDVDILRRERPSIVDTVRTLAPKARLIALLPCGGLPAMEWLDSDFKLEKPHLLRQLVAALDELRT